MKSNGRPKVAVFKMASCDGCQLSLLDAEDEGQGGPGRIDRQPVGLPDEGCQFRRIQVVSVRRIDDGQRAGDELGAGVVSFPRDVPVIARSWGESPRGSKSGATIMVES